MQYNYMTPVAILSGKTVSLVFLQSFAYIDAQLSACCVELCRPRLCVCRAGHVVISYSPSHAQEENDG